MIRISTMIALVFLVSPASAQILDVPFVVTADGAGAFSYTATMTYPPTGAYFGGYTIYGTENIAEGAVFIDGFCMSWVSGGTVTTFLVEGTLADPAANGAVDFEWFGCDPGFSVTAPTMILAPGVPNDAPTWSALKRRYR